MKFRLLVYKFKCSSCDLIFLVENNGGLDHTNRACCPMCDKDIDVDKMVDKLWIEEGEKK